MADPLEQAVPWPPDVPKTRSYWHELSTAFLCIVRARFLHVLTSNCRLIELAAPFLCIEHIFNYRLLVSKKLTLVLCRVNRMFSLQFETWCLSMS